MTKSRSKAADSSASATEHADGTTTRGDAAAVRTGLDKNTIAAALVDNLHYLLAKLPRHATAHDWYTALAFAVRDRMLGRYISTLEAILDPANKAKVVAYLSAEFLTGPHLGNGLINLGIWDAARDALSGAGQDLTTILDQ